MSVKKKRAERDETAVLGKAEIPPVDIKNHKKFIASANRCAVDLTAAAAERQQRNDEYEHRKSVARNKRRLKKVEVEIAISELRGKVSNILKPITVPVGNKIAAGRNYVSVKYDAFVAETAIRTENEKKDRLFSLNNAVIPFIFNTKGISEIEEKSQFTFYKVTNYYGGKMHKGEGIHYVAVKRDDSYRDTQNSNIVVMSLWDDGDIEVRGNCNSYREKMNAEATSNRANPYDYSEMEMMWWDDRSKDLTFQIEKHRCNKYPHLEPYLGFSRNAVSLTGRIKETVVSDAKTAFMCTLLSQRMYAKQGQVIDYINV